MTEAERAEYNDLLERHPSLTPEEEARLDELMELWEEENPNFGQFLDFLADLEPGADEDE